MTMLMETTVKSSEKRDRKGFGRLILGSDPNSAT